MVGHDSLGAEARALLDVLTERLESAAGTADTAPSTPTAGEPPHNVRCTGCPICAGLTYLREHRELSTQLAQGALLIVAALRQYLDSPAAGGPTPTPSAVQHIAIS